MEAFKVLDPEGKGYIRKDVMKTLLTSQGIPLRPREYESFIQAAQDKSGQYIYYEDYVAKLVDENERHKDLLIKDFDTFKPPVNAPKPEPPAK